MTDPNGLIRPGRPAPGFTLQEAPRALVVIGPDGTVAWSHLSPTDVNPGVDGILDALDRLPADRQVVAG